MSPPIPSLQDARILVVDDEAANVRFLSRMLERSGYLNVGAATDPREALLRFIDEAPDLVLLDLNMPGLDGFGVLERLREMVPAGTYLPVLAITGVPSAEAKRRALSLGAKDFVGKPFEPVEVLLRIRNLLEARMLHRSLERERGLLEVRVRERTRELEGARLDALRRLARAAEYRDDDTGQHTQRVGELSACIARGLGMAEEEVEKLRRAAPLHDVGKIGIPDAILLKPGPLTDTERAIMQTHTLIGADLLAAGGSPLMELAETIARSHHERWDGTGYPQGIQGEAIPLAARIVAVADFHDALSHARPYRPAWSRERVLREIRSLSGAHFDPQVVNAFLGAPAGSPVPAVPTNSVPAIEWKLS